MSQKNKIIQIEIQHKNDKNIYIYDKNTYKINH